MPVYAAIYDYTDETAAARAELLDSHRAWLTTMKEQGRLLEAGILIERPGSILAITAETLEHATLAFDEDPFQKAGLVSKRAIAEWRVGWGVVAEAVK
jgi:uncharacterized protein YciI